MRARFVGLTGGLGAGKSTALAMLEGLGAAVLSSDAVVRELYGTGEVRDAVRAHFGAEVFDASSGEVDRVALARRAFATEADRAWLEALLWPLVARRAQAFRSEAERRTPAPVAIVIEVPLLFEAQTESRYDATIAVVADDALRAQRVEARGLSELVQRERRQLPQPEKARRADFVVVNDGTLEALREQLTGVLAKLSG